MVRKAELAPIRVYVGRCDMYTFPSESCSARIHLRTPGVEIAFIVLTIKVEFPLDHSQTIPEYRGPRIISMQQLSPIMNHRFSLA